MTATLLLIAIYLNYIDKHYFGNLLNKVDREEDIDLNATNISQRQTMVEPQPYEPVQAQYVANVNQSTTTAGFMSTSGDVNSTQEVLLVE